MSVAAPPNVLKKEYVIEIRYNGKVLKDMKPAYTCIADRSNFNDMVLLSEDIIQKYFDAECITDELELPYTGLSLKVYSGDEVLFANHSEFDAYRRKHKIECRLRSNWSLVTYVNDIEYHGELLPGMIPNNRGDELLKMQNQLDRLSKRAVLKMENERTRQDTQSLSELKTILAVLEGTINKIKRIL